MNPGDVIENRFVIERLAGRGGMGLVYAARDASSGGKVALKILHEPIAPEVPADAHTRRTERFMREAVALAALDHPGIVKHVSHGAMPDGRMFLAMEWLDGEDLATRLSRGRLPVSEALELVGRAADALGSAHALDIVHRDVKPSNLFLGADGEVRVIDFGVARLGGRNAMTRTGATLGTIGYMAPEQASAALHVDARADVFSLGCVLFECLTGRVAFAGTQLVAVLTKVLFEHPPNPSKFAPEVSPAVDALVARMLAKDPSDRPANGHELARAIRALSTAAAAGPVDALTRAEQRGVSIVLAVPPSPSPSPSGGVGDGGRDSTTGTLDDPRQLLGAPEGRVAHLANGAFAIVVAGAGHGADHARKAAKSALALRAARPDMSIAVVTGRALIAGTVPVGEAIDRAAALAERSASTRSARATGAIHVDEATAHLLEMRFDIVNGELRGERVVEDTRTLLGRATPFVGRERELHFLTGLVVECVGEPIARAAVIVAPPGVGKSRLCRELVTALRTTQPAMRIWLARGDSIRQGSPFGMLARALEHAFGISGEDAPELARQKIRDRVADRLGDRFDTAITTEILGELMGLPFSDEGRPLLRSARQDPSLMGDRMREAWLTWLKAEVSASPILVLVEDLHWGDLPSVKFLDAALDQLRDRPLFVVATARPEVTQVFPALWSRHELQEIRLPSLTRGASSRLVREVLGSIDPDDADRIVERAGGNAFFLEELIRAHAEGKRTETPETVRAIVRARLEELPATARHVLRAASVFGEVSWRDAIETLLGDVRDLSEIDVAIDLLVEREILQRRRDGRYAEELAFRHAFVRDAAYDMLTETDRVLGHRLAGAWLADNGERDAMTLAEHFERGAAPDRAIPWFHRGAAQALEGNDLVAAIERARRGIACGAKGDALGALHLLEAQAHSWRGENLEAARAASEALVHLRHGSDPWFEATCEAAVVHRRLGNWDLLHDMGRSLCMLDELPTASAVALRTASRLVVQLTIEGWIPVARKLRDAVLRHRALSSSDRAVRSWARIADGLSAMADGDPSGLLNVAGSLIADIDASGDRRFGCNMRYLVGVAARSSGAYELAENLQAEAIATAETLGIHTMSYSSRNELCRILADTGRAAQGLEMLMELAALRGQHDRMQEAYAETTAAMTLLALREPARALEHLEHALVGMSERSLFRAETLALRARAFTMQGQRADALASAESAMTLLDSRQHAGWATPSIYLARVEARAAVNDLVGARSDAERACLYLRERATRFHDPLHARAYLERVPDHVRLQTLASELGVERS